MDEVCHAKGKVIAMVAGANGSTIARDVASGQVTLWTVQTDATHTAEISHLVTCDTFAYPLLKQPALRIRSGVWVLPAAGGDVKNYVLSLFADDDFGGAAAVAAFGAEFERHTTLRDRDAPVTEGGAAGGDSAPLKSTATSASSATSGAVTSAGAVVVVGSAALAPAARQGAVSNPTLASASATVGSGLVQLGAFTRQALVAGASIAGRGVSAASAAVAARMGPATQPLEISQTTASRLQNARVLTRAAVVVTGSMVEGAVALARSLGTAAAHAAAETETGKRILSSAATPAGTAATTVAVASLAAFRDVWDGLEEAAQIVGHATADATRTVSHARYGAAGDPVTESVIGLAADVGAIAINTNRLTVGGMVRRTAAETAGQLVDVSMGAPPRPASLAIGNTAGPMETMAAVATLSQAAAAIHPPAPARR